MNAIKTIDICVLSYIEKWTSSPSSVLGRPVCNNARQ